MKLRLEHAPFAAAVADAARALPARPPAPVLAGLKLEAAAGQLTVAAFDYEVSAQAGLAADIAKAGSVLVPGRLLSDITRTVTGKNPVELELVGPRLVLTSGSTRYTLHTLPEEYPSLPKLGDASGTAAGRDLAQAVAQVAVAAGRDDTLPVLTGIHLTVADGKLTLAATDRYRFAVRTIDFTSTSDIAEGQAVIPAKACSTPPRCSPTPSRSNSPSPPARASSAWPVPHAAPRCAPWKASCPRTRICGPPSSKPPPSSTARNSPQPSSASPSSPSAASPSS